jgi:hypothetical protein
MHVDNIDYESHCKKFTDCLAIVRDWSDANPSHIPLILRVEMKLSTMIETLEQADAEAAATLNSEVVKAAQVCTWRR